MTVKLAVVVPCFRVKRHILDVLNRIGPEVWKVYVVDDQCPEGSGALVREKIRDERVSILQRERNGGVGAATLTGVEQAVIDGAEVVVKIDGDGQMDPAHISAVAAPILRGEADYAKGNRFFHLEGLRSMPVVRLWGNAALSFMTKLSSGYWAIFDPTNGFVAIHADIVRLLPTDKIAPRYFFESDMLFRLNTIRAVVRDVPLPVRYGDEVSGLSVSRAIPQFVAGNLRNFTKRVFYNYLLRDFSVGSIYLIAGLPLFIFGLIFGALSWWDHAQRDVIASAGTVMLAALPIIIGFQLLLAFMAYDVQSVPQIPLHSRLPDHAKRAAKDDSA